MEVLQTRWSAMKTKNAEMDDLEVLGSPTAWALTPALPELSWNGMEKNDLFTSAFPQESYKNI